MQTLCFHDCEKHTIKYKHKETYECRHDAFSCASRQSMLLLFRNAEGAPNDIGACAALGKTRPVTDLLHVCVCTSVYGGQL